MKSFFGFKTLLPMFLLIGGMLMSFGATAQSAPGAGPTSVMSPSTFDLVDDADAGIILDGEIVNLNGALANGNPGTSQFNYDKLQLQLLESINERLANGMTLEDAISSSFNDLAGTMPTDVPGSLFDDAQWNALYLEVVALLAN